MANNPDPKSLINQILQSDPEIQQIIKGVWGDTTAHQRPSDTPKNLEKANDTASKQIKAVLARKGINLPARTFINPRTNSVEGMRGWAGLPPAAKIAIIGAAAATGIGAASALGAFGGAAAGGAGAAGAGSAAIPSIGVTGGLSAGAFPAIAGTTGAGLTGAGLAGGAGLLGSTSLASAAPQIRSAAATGNLAGTGAAKMGIGSTIANYAKKKGGEVLGNLLTSKVLESAGRGTGAIAATEAHNRGNELEAMMDADEMRMRLARDRRDDESDLWSKLQAASYMKSGGTPKPTTPTLSANGKPFTQFDFGPAPISQDNKDMATTMEAQLLKRLHNPATLSDYESKMKPGAVEKTLNWASPSLSIFSEIMKARGGQQPMGTATPTPTMQPGQGTATPTPNPPVPYMPEQRPLFRLPGQVVE